MEEDVGRGRRMQALSALLSSVKSSENPSEMISKEFIPTWEHFASSCRGQILDCTNFGAVKYCLELLRWLGLQFYGWFTCCYSVPVALTVVAFTTISCHVCICALA